MFLITAAQKGIRWELSGGAADIGTIHRSFYIFCVKPLATDLLSSQLGKQHPIRLIKNVLNQLVKAWRPNTYERYCT